jgi:hypothetical protein
MTINEMAIVNTIKRLEPIIGHYYKDEADNVNIISFFVDNSDFGTLNYSKTILDILHAIQSIDPTSFSLGSLSENRGDSLEKSIQYWHNKVYGNIGTIRMIRNETVDN